MFDIANPIVCVTLGGIMNILRYFISLFQVLSITQYYVIRVKTFYDNKGETTLEIGRTWIKIQAMRF